MNKFIDTQVENRYLSTIWAIIFCATYVFLMNGEHKLYTVATPFHLCLLFSCILFTGSMATLYSWVNRTMFVIYHSFVHFTMLLIGIASLKLFFHYPEGYLIFLTEFVALLELIVYTIGIGAIISFPFKFIQSYYYDVAMYEGWSEGQSRNKTNVPNNLKEDLELETKNETELGILLQECLKNEKFEKATKIKNIIHRKFR
jgi:hypothetical protein